MAWKIFEQFLIRNNRTVINGCSTMKGVPIVGDHCDVMEREYTLQLDRQGE